MLLFLTSGGFYLAAKSIEIRLFKTISGHGRGWVFSSKDFVRIGSRSAIDTTLHRLMARGIIRRVLRGIYDFPKFSDLLAQPLSVDLDAVAAALARKFGWRIQVTGASALNFLGLSTQVPGRVVYASDGPDRVFKVGKRTLEFRHTVLKDAIFDHRESSLIVQGLKSLGRERITPDVIESIRAWLAPSLRQRVLRDAQNTTGWVQSAIVQICREER
jgi:hypothetical protein